MGYTFYDSLMYVGYRLGQIPLVPTLYYMAAILIPPAIALHAVRRGRRLRRASEQRLRDTATPSWRTILDVVLAPIAGILRVLLLVMAIGLVVFIWQNRPIVEGDVQTELTLLGTFVDQLWNQFLLGFWLLLTPTAWGWLLDIFGFGYINFMMATTPALVPFAVLDWTIRWLMLALNVQIIVSVLVLLVGSLMEAWRRRQRTPA